VAECRHLKVTPHIAQNTKRCGGSAIDGCTTRHSGYEVSQKIISDGVKLIEIMREKARELNIRFSTRLWTPRRIDMVLWVADR
jgi:hypothetical protein